MGTKRFKIALLSVSVTTLLVVSILVLASTTEAVWEPDLGDIILRGKDTAYNTNLCDPPPMKSYDVGDCPPIMAADRIGSGAVIAAGTASTCRGGETYDPQRWVQGEWDILVDEMFQWMVPGATDVLWYGEEADYNVYNDAPRCSWLIADLEENFGYSIDNTADSTHTEIDSSLLSPYDILVIPQMELGSGSAGGDPDLLPDSVVTAIKNFVEGGGGLLIMDASDFSCYNFYKVHNKILEGLNFRPMGAGFLGFQSDAVYDEDYNQESSSYLPIVDVDTTTDIGSAYQSAAGKTTVGLYSPCSLYPVGPAIVMYIIPSYEENVPGEELTYRVKVFNTGNEDLTVSLDVDDTAGWGPTLDDESLGLIPADDNETTLLRVTVPGGASFCEEDNITVTATTSEYPGEVSDNYTVTAHAALRLPVTGDAYVRDDEPDANYGDLNYLYVGRYYDYWQYAYLKFSNLDEIPSDATITEAKLCLWAWDAYGSPQQMEVKESDDLWTEMTINWNNKPTPAATLDTQLVSIASEMEPVLYTWDVTDFVESQFEGDKTASFCVVPLDNCNPSTNRTFEARDWWYWWVRPYLRIIYTLEEEHDVDVSISPSTRSGAAGDTLSYTVTITNTGGYTDTYDLEKSDTAGWTLDLSEDSVGPLAPDASENVTLEVTIPSDAENGDSTTVTVTATCQADPSVDASDTCTAAAGEVFAGVDVEITPSTKSGAPGDTLSYTVRVTNTGGAADTFTLAKSNTADWTLSLPNSTGSISPGAHEDVTLGVTISSDAEAGDSTTVTVTATSQADPSENDSDTCTAATGGGGVKVTIGSPTTKSGSAGDELAYLVTVKNTGETADNYSLEATDTAGWGPDLSPDSCELDPGESRSGIALTVTIPSTAGGGDSSTVTVTATSQTDSTVSDSDICTAKVEAAGEFPLILVVGAVVVMVVIIGVIVVIRH